MAVTRAQAIHVLVSRHKEALAQAQKFRCACCEGIFDRKEASHVDSYTPQNVIMQRLIPGYNIATYVVCQVCARLPEKEMLMKVERYLIREGGILRPDLKPMDAPGGHSPGHQPHKHGPNCSHKHGGELFPGRG